MEFNGQIKALADKVLTMKEQITTEEATKTAFIMPLIMYLGYDIFNPSEVVPEFVADVGLKKGEKVDYAIFKNGNPVLIIECKHWKENLDNHDSQLVRYFHVTKTRFALLTNGIEYKFFTDLDAPNIMDGKPFLEFDITKIKDNQIAELYKFHNQNFDVNSILNNASTLKYMKELKKAFNDELQNPSTEFIKLFAGKVYNGRFTEKVMDEFRDLVTKSIQQFITEKVNERLTNALTVENEKAEEENEVEEVVSKIETTEDELESFRIVRAIIRKTVDIDRIAFRDAQSYFSILFDDNNRKPVCRLYLNGKQKYIGLFDAEKKETKLPLDTLDQLYDFNDQLLEIVAAYLN